MTVLAESALERDAKAIEKANSYREMMGSWAWRDFESFLHDERSSALEIGINCEDQKEVQMNRGKVRQVDAIFNHLGYVLGGTK